jgi:hypothetical protein
MGTRQVLQKKLDACDEQRRQLTAQLAQLGYIWHGSLLRRRLTCGKVGCACKRDPDARHGPYAYWTTKVAGRTVSRLLPPLEATLYEEWIANRRALEETLVQLRSLSAKAARIILKLNSSETD